MINILQRDLDKLNPDDRPLQQHDFSSTQTGPLPFSEDFVEALETQNTPAPEDDDINESPTPLPESHGAATKVRPIRRSVETERLKTNYKSHVQSLPVWISHVLWMILGALLTLLFIWLFEV